jgi:hypothetical protein
MVEFDKWVTEPEGHDYAPRIFEIQHDVRLAEGKSLRYWLEEAYKAGYLEGLKAKE